MVLRWKLFIEGDGGVFNLLFYSAGAVVVKNKTAQAVKDAYHYSDTCKHDSNLSVSIRVHPLVGNE